MKKLMICCFIIAVAALSACESKTDSTSKAVAESISSDEQKDLKGTFTANGKTYSGKVSTQNFGATGQFSVLCEDDSKADDYKLIQFVFKDEKSARSAGTFNALYDQGKDQTPTDVSVSFDISWHSTEDSKGTFTISKSGGNSEMVFDNVTLTNVEKEKIVVSGKIPF